jgi:hypothetical protein
MHRAAERRQQVALAHPHQRGRDLVGIAHGGAAGSGLVPDPLGGESLDVGGLHSAGQPDRLIAPVDGIYSVSGAVCWEPNATGMRQLQLRVDSADGPAASSWPARSRVGAAGDGTTCQSVSALVGVPAGSAVRLVPSQSTSGTLNILGTTSGGEQGTHLAMAWLGPRG